MSVFVVSLCVGLGGLLLMAVPGVRRHGRAGHARAARGRSGAARGRGGAARGRGGAARGGRAPLHGGHVVRHAGRGARAAQAQPGQAHAHQVPRPQRGEPVSAVDGLLHYVPEPRVVLTVIALFGAFGNVLAHVTAAPFVVQLVGAALSAALVEWLIVGRIWKLALRFTGEPSSPLETLIMQRVQAVTAFRNGKGIVQVERDGRALQMAAELVTEDRDERVGVGDRLTVEDVDAEHERVVVSTH